jgi:protoheme IX farnesyltransferase
MKAVTLAPEIDLSPPAAVAPLAPAVAPSLALRACEEAPALALRACASRWGDYLALTKPRVAVLVLFTVGAGVLLASAPALPLALLFHAVFGTALVAAGASALNQYLERHSDARMRRTQDRPLPAGRLQPLEVLAFGVLLGCGGVVYLLLALPAPGAALAAAFTFVCYVAVYTPLKGRTTLNTLVGAVPGAMPPVIGWCAVTGEVTTGALTLFVILFLWQVPHFLAIAWMYRDEYARAGLCMLPVIDPDGRLTGRQMVLYCLALIPVSLGPVLLDSAGVLYTGGALLLGLYFLRHALRFQAGRSTAQARRVLRVSLVYLPGLLALLLLDRSVTALLSPR